MEQHGNERAGRDRSQDETRLGEQEHPIFVDHRAPFRLSGICRQPDEAKRGHENDRAPGVGPGEPPSAGQALGSMCRRTAEGSVAPSASLACE